MSRDDHSRGSVIIRQCRPGDLDQVLGIERAAFPDPYDRFTFAQLLELDPRGFLVAEREELLGYVAGVADKEEAMIYSIAVAEGNRRTGIGERLLSAELNYFSEKARRVYLQVSVKNSAAISLYRRFSFVEMGRIRKYYRNGDDALIMSLDLVTHR